MSDQSPAVLQIEPARSAPRPSQARKTKVLYATDSPYGLPKTPELSFDDQEVVLGLLCSLLRPLGTHRAQLITRSKSKRAYKRKRLPSKHYLPPIDATDGSVTLPSPPTASQHILVGFNSVTHHLESLASASSACDSGSHSHASLAVVFFTPNTLPNLLVQNLPLQVYLASHSRPSTEPTRLISLTYPESLHRLSQALRQPRVGFIGLFEREESGVKSLVDLCRRKTSPIHIPWLEDVELGIYTPVKIRRIATMEGSSTKDRKGKKQTKKVKRHVQEEH